MAESHTHGLSTIASNPAPGYALGMDRIPATVFACLTQGQITLMLFPGYGLADGGVPHEVPIDQIPFELRTPNTPLWLEVDEGQRILGVSRRDPDPPPVH